MKKSIYLITNQVNGKQYVGQSINPKLRFEQHCNNKTPYRSLIHDAIKKYGKENFTLQILESDIENYNEREIYWISYYNTVSTGYNICEGGESGPILRGLDHGNSMLTQTDLDKIIDLLLNTQQSYLQIANSIGANKRTIMRINNGEAYKQDICYPIRPIVNSSNRAKLTNEEALEIHEWLKYSYLSHGQIAAMYGVEKTVILKIERGETQSYRQDGEEYPLRDYKSSGKPATVDYEQVSAAIELLLTTDYSLYEISSLTQIERPILMKIKDGTAKRFRRKNLEYPLRPNDYSNK